MTTVRKLRIWRTKSEKICSKFFIKEELLFGSSKEADVREDQLKPLEARLDIKTMELLNLESGEVVSALENEPFQVGESIYQWTSVSVSKKQQRLGAVLGGSLIIVLLLCFFVPQKDAQIKCSSLETKIYHQKWSDKNGSEIEQQLFKKLRQIRLEFKAALREGQLLIARSLLSEMKKTILEQNMRPECGGLHPIYELEEGLVKKILSQKIKEGDLISASEVFMNFKSKAKNPSVLEGFDRKLRYYALRRYQEGYQKSDFKPEEAFDLMEEARTICRVLQEVDTCFRKGG